MFECTRATYKTNTRDCSPWGSVQEKHTKSSLRHYKELLTVTQISSSTSFWSPSPLLFPCTCHPISLPTSHPHPLLQTPPSLAALDYIIYNLILVLILYRLRSICGSVCEFVYVICGSCRTSQKERQESASYLLFFSPVTWDVPAFPPV